ncbi:methyltransferase domain-containing protein [Amycolatopsis alba]|uniref:Protein-L-isoaspartate O-methyltransferase n=1 Tax=Amycolatopsis alba DSM 44262 TaxID=1125972 RepID=A0A229R8Z7_AMYAL|nr:methyltransferase domain-containing protein [Amycolatopsis alba]OXM43118.1 protein-L-isoaspartate(D-aspartate) O-methyltransferase [Amycolatopsis alba DSM 44262]
MATTILKDGTAVGSDAAFERVDRAAFIPARIWADDENGRPQPINRATEPARWWAAVEQDAPIVTQLDDGATVWPATSMNATSSASEPSLVRGMLDRLDVRPGHRVLEIGTGTGYNTALLCALADEENVTSIEVDPVLADGARASLHAAGYRPTVITGDGAAGHQERAPFDRIIATCAVTAGHIPHAWVAQAAEHGTILSPWGTAFHNGVQVHLTADGRGRAQGRVVDSASFMRLRAQRSPFGHASRLSDLIDSADVATETTSLSPDSVRVGPAAFAVGVQLADVQQSMAHDIDGEGTDELLLYHVPSDSVATVHVTTDAAATGKYRIRQLGPRQLWTEAETAHAWWRNHGEPEHTRFGLTISTTGQEIWLDEPGNVVRTWPADAPTAA